MVSRKVAKKVVYTVMSIVEVAVLVLVVLYLLVPAELTPSIPIFTCRNSNIIITYSAPTSFGTGVFLAGGFIVFPAVAFLAIACSGDRWAIIPYILGFICFCIAISAVILINNKFGTLFTNLVNLIEIGCGRAMLFSLAQKYCGSHSVACLLLLEEMPTDSPILQTCSREVLHNTAFKVYKLDLACILKRLSTNLTCTCSCDK